MPTKEKIKVLTITTSGLEKKEGISTVILDYYRKLDKKKYELHIIASGKYDRELVEDFKKAGVIVKRIPSRKEDFLAYCKALLRLLKKEKYDTCYLHGSSALMTFELLMVTLFGCKNRVVHSHNTTCNHKIIDKVLRPLFYRLITVKLACGKDAGKWLYGKNKFYIINNGREPEEYKFDSQVREKMRGLLGLKGDCIAMGHVGNFTDQKNQLFLVELFKMIHDENSNTKLFLIGDGPRRMEVEQLACRCGLENSVIFTGSVRNVPDYLQAMDVMVLPSLHEGLPLVVVEWQMSGLPSVISSNVTKECAFSDLVSFIGLDAPKSEWISCIMNNKDNDREVESKKAIQKARVKGFDINRGIVILDKALSRRV